MSLRFPESGNDTFREILESLKLKHEHLVIAHRRFYHLLQDLYLLTLLLQPAGLALQLAD